MIKHKHAELIKAWADGHTIEYLESEDGEWYPITLCNPSWDINTIYRVAPNEPTTAD